jgi:hypothetical protein
MTVFVIGVEGLLAHQPHQDVDLRLAMPPAVKQEVSEEQLNLLQAQQAWLQAHMSQALSLQQTLSGLTSPTLSAALACPPTAHQVSEKASNRSGYSAAGQELVGAQLAASAHQQVS